MYQIHTLGSIPVVYKHFSSKQGHRTRVIWKSSKLLDNYHLNQTINHGKTLLYVYSHQFIAIGTNLSFLLGYNAGSRRTEKADGTLKVFELKMTRNISNWGITIDLKVKELQIG